MDAQALEQIRNAAAALVEAIDDAIGGAPRSARASSKNLMTTAEIATELKRSPETVTRWRRERMGPPYIRMQGRVLYDRNAVEKWLEESK